MNAKKVALITLPFVLAAMFACSDDDDDNSQDAVLDETSSAETEESSSAEADGTSTDTSSLKGVLIDDFEDGDGESLLGSYWYAYNDEDNGAASTYSTPVNADGDIAAGEEGYESSYAFRIDFVLNQGSYAYDPYVGFGVNIPDDVERTNLAGIQYWYKGAEHKVMIGLSDITDYDQYSYSVDEARDWTQATVLFENMAQGGWGEAVDFNVENITAFSIQVSGDGLDDSLLIDYVYLMDSSEVPEAEADMTIRAAVIPTVTIGDITISNALQEKAMTYLNKGINFTNWLEESDGKFQSFEFDESDVKLISESGLKALRLPIDLDLYANNRDEFVAGTDSVLDIDTDTLFMVLDSFVEWTDRYGLSLTIDYHEYDGSYNETTCTDTRYNAMMATLWKTVAEHYASNEREDIFYELFNEPGNGGGGSIAQSDWTTTAQGMIDSIRTVDSVHTILFGDVEWYDASYLVKREPFSDDNIIYVIHNYDPFVFTHQGASWGDAATIKNIPFPYDTTKWSEYSSYFGITSSTASWVKTAIKGYYKTGNKETIINNVLEAKEWAVEHNVPLAVNEFGAYNLRSDAESRLNYLQAVREMSDTLEVPIQHWGYTGGFSLFEDGALIDGVKEALDL